MFAEFYDFFEWVGLDVGQIDFFFYSCVFDHVFEELAFAGHYFFYFEFALI